VGISKADNNIHSLNWHIMNLPNQLTTPPLLQTLQLIAQPTKFLETCAAKYGDIFTVRVSGYPTVIKIKCVTTYKRGAEKL
jgi:hypothetical protein